MDGRSEENECRRDRGAAGRLGCCGRCTGAVAVSLKPKRRRSASVGGCGGGGGGGASGNERLVDLDEIKVPATLALREGGGSECGKDRGPDGCCCWWWLREDVRERSGCEGGRREESAEGGEGGGREGGEEREREEGEERKADDGDGGERAGEGKEGNEGGFLENKRPYRFWFLWRAAFPDERADEELLDMESRYR